MNVDNFVRITAGQDLRRSKFILPDGSQITGISECTIRMSIYDRTKAEITLVVSAVDLDAHPLLSLQTLHESAAHHGFDLVKK